MMRIVLPCVLVLAPVTGLAQEVRLGCVLDRVYTNTGAPAALIARFDEQAKTASLFAQELGGLATGSNVSFARDSVMFEFDAEGRPGKALIDRIGGSLTVSVPGVGYLNFSSRCRSEDRRF